MGAKSLYHLVTKTRRAPESKFRIAPLSAPLLYPSGVNSCLAVARRRRSAANVLHAFSSKIVRNRSRRAAGVLDSNPYFANYEQWDASRCCVNHSTAASSGLKGFRVHGLKDGMSRDHEHEYSTRLYRKQREAGNPVVL